MERSVGLGRANPIRFGANLPGGGIRQSTQSTQSICSDGANVTHESFGAGRLASVTVVVSG